MSFAERIVGYGRVDPRELKPHPGNWREHPEAQLEALERILDDLGQIAPLIVSQRTSRVLNGHARLRLALDQGLDEVQVVWVDIPEDDELAVLASFDAVAMMRDVRQRQTMELMRSQRVSQHADWLQAVHGVSAPASPVSVGRDGATETESEPTPRRRRRGRKRNRAWYVYVPHLDADDVHDWLEEHLGAIEGVEVGGE